MALDPTISLKAGGDPVQFDPVGTMNKAYTLKKLMTDVQFQPQLLQQRLASERASQLGTEASTAGQLLLNEQTARELATKKRLAEIARNKAKVDKDGKLSFDHMDIANTAAQEGLDAGTVFAYMDKASESAQKNIKTGEDETKFATSTLSTANNMIRTQTDPAKALVMAKSTMDILGRVLGPEKAKQYASQFWNVPDTPAADPQEAGMHFIRQAQINQQSTISPQQTISNAQTWTQLAQNAESIAQSGASGISGVAERDPGTPVSREAQDAYIAANPTLTPEQVARVRTMSAAALTHLPATGEIIRSNITPGGTRAGAATAATNLSTEADFYDRLAAAADKIKNKYPELTPINILANKVNQAILSNPDANEYYALVREAQGKGLNLAAYASRESFSQVAKGKAKELRTQAQTQGKLVASPTLTTAPGTPANPAAQQSTPKNTIKKFKEGSFVKLNDGPDNDEKNWMKIK